MKTGIERKAALLDIGARLVSKHGTTNVTRRMVAEKGKCSEGLVSSYFGATADAQKIYARQTKKLGLPIPDKAQTAALGAKLRKHKKDDVRDVRPRSVKEVKVIVKKSSAATIKPTIAGKKLKPAKTRVTPGPSEDKVIRKAPSAARLPKLPPLHPLPVLPITLPPLV